MAEYFSWTNITFQEKIDLTTLYGPYLALCKSLLILFPLLALLPLPLLGLCLRVLWFVVCEEIVKLDHRQCNSVEKEERRNDKDRGLTGPRYCSGVHDCGYGC